MTELALSIRKIIGNFFYSFYAGNDDWGNGPSSKAASSNNDGWDDAPTPSNNRQNGKFRILFYPFGNSIKIVSRTTSPHCKIVSRTYKKSIPRVAQFVEKEYSS